MRDPFGAASAALISKFSPTAQSKRKEIAAEFRALALKTLDVSIGELRRLIADTGNSDYSEMLSLNCLLRQQVETKDVLNPIAMGELLLQSDAAKSVGAKDYFSSAGQLKKKELEERMLILSRELMELMEQELLRLGFETSGQQGKEYIDASFLISSMRQQLQTEELHGSKMSGVLGLAVDSVRKSAEDKVRKQSQRN